MTRHRKATGLLGDTRRNEGCLGWCCFARGMAPFPPAPPGTPLSDSWHRIQRLTKRDLSAQHCQNWLLSKHGAEETHGVRPELLLVEKAARHHLLAEAQHVRRVVQPPVLVGPELAGTAASSLHLVHQEAAAVLFGESERSRSPRVGRMEGPRGAGDRSSPPPHSALPPSPLMNGKAEQSIQKLEAQVHLSPLDLLAAQPGLLLLFGSQFLIYKMGTVSVRSRALPGLLKLRLCHTRGGRGWDLGRQGEGPAGAGSSRGGGGPCRASKQSP